MGFTKGKWHNGCKATGDGRHPANLRATERARQLGGATEGANKLSTVPPVPCRLHHRAKGLRSTPSMSRTPSIRHQALHVQVLGRRVVDLEGRVLHVELLLEEALEVEADQVAVVVGVHEDMGRERREA